MIYYKIAETDIIAIGFSLYCVGIFIQTDIKSLIMLVDSNTSRIALYIFLADV